MARSRDDSSPSPPPPDLPYPHILRVPSDLAIHTGLQAPRWLPAGAKVSRGDSLLSQPSESQGTPVAPADGTIGPPVVVRLLGGREVFGIEFKPAESAPSDQVRADAVDLPAVARQLEAITPTAYASWLTRIQQSGIAADRWTCPDLLGQLRDALTRPIDTLICNLLDSDPWLPIARTVCNALPAEVAAGLGLLGRLTGAPDWWALVDQADDAPAPLRRAAAELAKSLRIGPVENDYPQLDPTLLVRSTTGRRLRPGRLPSSKGVLLVDAAAAAAIGRLLLADSAMTHVPIAVYDQPKDAIYALSAPLGTPVGWIFQTLAIPFAVREVFAGGPLRQVRVREDDVIGRGELTLFAAPPQPLVPPEPCVRCGWCVEACPTRCRPASLLEAAQREDVELARHNGLDACIECGLCTFVCPSRLPLLEGIRILRKQEKAESPSHTAQQRRTHDR